jgi:hypothetical protein
MIKILIYPEIKNIYKVIDQEFFFFFLIDIKNLYLTLEKTKKKCICSKCFCPLTWFFLILEVIRGVLVFFLLNF